MSQMPARNRSSLNWAKVDLSACPRIVVPPPGPASNKWHARCTKHFKGLSGQVKLFPVAFESGNGCVLVNVDGNRYLDFSSGIYVTTLGHCHPKVSEAVARYAHQLMNAHDFTTRVKTLLVEKLVEVLPGDLSGFQFYDAGTAAVEAGMRVLRAATGRNEMLSCFNDFHGKTYGAVSLARYRSPVYGRVRMPGAHMVPRPNVYRPLWSKPDGTIDTDRYIAFYDEYIEKGTVGDVAGFVLEPIQGWAGSVMPPDDFFPKLRTFCDRKKLLLMADEVLTSWGRTGKWLCMEHWGVVPDVVAVGSSARTSRTCPTPFTRSPRRLTNSPPASWWRRNTCADIDFSKQIHLLERATDIVLELVKLLRKGMDLEKVKDLNDKLQFLESEADNHMMSLYKDLFSGKHDPLQVIALKDLYELLEKVIDRCRDAGNVIAHIALKNS